MVRMTKFLLKLGILTFKEQEIINSMFGYMCLLLDIFTHRRYAKEQQSLEKITSKDSITEDYVKTNPIMKAFNDLKYQVLNKKDWDNFANKREEQEEDGSDSFK
jgi:hypothetical protein